MGKLKFGINKQNVGFQLILFWCALVRLNLWPKWNSIGKGKGEELRTNKQFRAKGSWQNRQEKYIGGWNENSKGKQTKANGTLLEGKLAILVLCQGIW
jgi:hypothetical protein